MASARSKERNDFRGHDFDRHQKRPFLSVAFAMKHDGGQIIVAHRSFMSSSTGRRNVRLPILTSRLAQIFSQILRSGTPPFTIFGHHLSAVSVSVACMKKIMKIHPPVAAAMSAIVVIRALSSRNRNVVFAAISERCALCAAQYVFHVMFGGFSCRSNVTKHSVADVIAPTTAKKSHASKPSRPGHSSLGPLHAMPTYA
jgi:hypothetical protein